MIHLPIDVVYCVSEIDGLRFYILIETAAKWPELMRRFGVVFNAMHPSDVYLIPALGNLTQGWARG